MCVGHKRLLIRIHLRASRRRNATSCCRTQFYGEARNELDCTLSHVDCICGVYNMRTDVYSVCSAMSNDRFFFGCGLRSAGDSYKLMMGGDEEKYVLSHLWFVIEPEGGMCVLICTLIGRLRGGLRVFDMYVTNERIWELVSSTDPDPGSVICVVYLSGTICLVTALRSLVFGRRANDK